MRISRWTARMFASGVALLCASAPLSAQGTTTGAISGYVYNEQGQGVQGVQVAVIHRPSGSRTGTLTNAEGHYYVQSLEVGGPYTVSIRRIGFAPRDTNNIFVSLGENFRVDFSLQQRVVRLTGVEITGTTTGAVMSASHKGIATTITDSTIANAPTLNRNFTDFMNLVPQISSKGPGFSGGGQNNRFNAIQIDGSVANDLFGLSSTLQPGGQAAAKQVSIEAIKEYQVLLSPYDVRQGSFTGFLMNAVTKSGSNVFQGSGTFATRTEKMERDIDYLRAAPFTQKQEGFWIGGPIVRDRLFFSIAPEFQQRQEPASGPYLNQPSSKTPAPPATQAAVDSFTNILKTRYGFADPGNGTLIQNENPLANMFARFDLVNLPKSSRLVARWNYVDAQQDIFSRSNTRLSLSNNGYNFRSKTNSGLAQLFSSFGMNANELLFGYTTIRDKRQTPIFAPFVVVNRVTSQQVGANGVAGTGQLSAGTENSSQGNELDQDVIEISDNLTIPWKSHRFTIGTKNNWYKVRNLFAQNSFGNFTFGTLDSLANNTPSSATLGINLDRLNGLNTDGAARFTARTLAFYAEDEWQARDNLNLVYGVRLDMPGLTDSPPTNQDILRTKGINTGVVPKNVKQWGPRIGFNWDVTSDQVNQLRGGTGIFVGNPAYVWLSNLFGNSGVIGYGNLACTSMATAPAMPNAGSAIATNCKGSTGTPAVTVNTVDPNLKFPSVWRSSIGFDRRLPYNTIGTIEAMYTRSVNSFYYQNIGLKATPIGTDRNGRALYGDITSLTGNPVPARDTIPGTTPARVLGDVIHLTNSKTRDYSYNITTQLSKRFSNNFEGSAAYTYGRSYNVWDLTSSVAFSNWSFGRSYGGRQDAQDLYPSKWDAPHRFVVNALYTLPRTRTGISMNWIGESGVPYEYVYGSDMNGDNSTANDLIYVPRNARDTLEVRFSANGAITPAMQQDSLENFIASHDCLNSQRGTILKRNSCRAPWDKVVNLSARQPLRTLGGQNFIVQLDVFNFLNLLNKNWGARDFGSTNSQSLLTRRSYVAASGQPARMASGAQGVFNYNSLTQFNTRNAASNYAMQLQLKYNF